MKSEVKDASLKVENISLRVKNSSLRVKKISLGFLLSAGILSFVVFAAISAGHIAPHDPEKANLELRFKEPCMEYPLGTDHMGRCVLSRIIFGARVSLSVGLLV